MVAVDALTQVWCIDAGAIDDLTAAGKQVDDEDLETRRTSANADDLATIIYTSGTTGRPKGCELTHGNFLIEAANVISAKDADATCRRLPGRERLDAALPAARPRVRAGSSRSASSWRAAQLGHTADVKNLIADLATFQPTFILSVPRVFEKVYNSAEQKAEAAGKGKIFRAAADTAIAYSEALERGRARA